MRFGVREICDVTLKALSRQTIGNQTFLPGEPVIYFDTLKTSTLEGAATTVYATGGAGNPRLIAWEGERTLTFTFEDALLSPKSFSILSGAGLIEAGEQTPIFVHQTVQTTDIYFPDETNDAEDFADGVGFIVLRADSGADINVFNPHGLSGNEANAACYILVMGEDVSEFRYEPCVPFYDTEHAGGAIRLVTLEADTLINEEGETAYSKLKALSAVAADAANACIIECKHVRTGDTVIVDYYVRKTAGTTQIEITPDQFGGYFYLEASTLFRKEATGEDMAAIFVIPRMKIQSNFTFTMAATGDPSTFTFTADAFPAYTKFDSTKRVLALLQVIDESAASENYVRVCAPQGESTLDTVDGQQLDPEGP